MNQVQTNSGIFMKVMPGARRFMMVATMLIAPMMELMPRMWIEKIRNGKPEPPCSESGGVQGPAGCGGRRPP